MAAQRPDNADPAELWGALNAPQRDVLSRLAASAEAEGGKALLVGGPVRDLLRGETLLHDIDVVTTTDARQVARRFAQQARAGVAKTTDFGTATVRARDGDPSVDLATARTETYSRPGALPTVTFPASIDADLHRRDVTINAMALPITPQGFGTLRDPTGGLADLRAGNIRVLHDATFRDDPTRLYRAARYAARFGFTVEPHTATLMRAAIADGALTTISPDRKRRELDLAIHEPDPVACFAAFDAFGLLRATSAALVWDDWVAGRVRRVLPTEWPVWAFFVCRQGDAAVERLLTDLPFGAIQKPMRLVIRVWRERDVIARVSRLSTLRPLLEKMSEHVALALLDGDPAAPRAAAFYARLDHLARQEMQWRHSFGNYLKGLGVAPGPVYREILDALRDARLDGDVETREDAEAFVQRQLAEHTPAP
jgi:tRNA nucleotidyltransferase (CCA-adding enzyme)